MTDNLRHALRSRPTENSTSFTLNAISTYVAAPAIQTSRSTEWKHFAWLSSKNGPAGFRSSSDRT
jgi:hypothetical protein